MAEVRLENVSKYYGRKRAVQNLNITCGEGEFFSIVGPTGAGKSTTLKMIAGIESISSGTIYFNEKPVNDLPPQERNVSMAFESYNLYPHMSVYDNIAFPLRAPRWRMHLTQQDEERRVREIAEFLGIADLLERLPQHLSGGQKQRVSLARALVRKPEVYLLDEPIAHLDARLKFSTQTLLKEFAATYRSTIIYVTHDYREALGLSDRMVVLRKGRIEQMGTPEEVYNMPATDFVGKLIGEPPMNIIDGEVVTKDGKTLFNVGDIFTISIRDDKVESMKRVARRENGRTVSRLGIRCEHINISRNRMSENSFQMPVYAIVHEAESSVVTFELGETFFYVRTRGEEGFRDYRVEEKVWLDFDQDNIFFYENTIDISKM